jgi:hypothetical protein
MAVVTSSAVYSRFVKGDTSTPVNLNGQNSGDVELPENAFELFMHHSDPNEIWLMRFFAAGVTPVAGDFTFANSFPILPSSRTTPLNVVRIDIQAAGFRPGKTQAWFYAKLQAGASTNTFNWNISVTTQVSSIEVGQKITGQL